MAGMGTCWVSNLPLNYGDDVVAFVIYETKKNSLTQYNDMWANYALPLYGKYNDYWSIEDITNREMIEFYMNHFGEKDEDEFITNLSRNEYKTISPIYVHPQYENTRVKLTMCHRSYYEEFNVSCDNFPYEYSAIDYENDFNKIIDNGINKHDMLYAYRRQSKNDDNKAGRILEHDLSVGHMLRVMDSYDFDIMELSKLIVFGHNMTVLRKLLSPTSAYGTDYNTSAEYNMHRKLNEISEELMQKQEKENNEWEEEDDEI